MEGRLTHRHLSIALCAGLVAVRAGAAETNATVEPGQALQGCMELKSAQERLTCYDTTLGRTPTGRSADELLPENRAKTPEEKVAEKTPPPAPSALAERWELVAQADRGPFVVTPYRPTYLLPFSYDFNPNEAAYRSDDMESVDHTEVKFQISFKTKIWPELGTRRGDLWLAYTQQSYWQAYNSEESAPFRETNYEPELIYSYRTNYNLFGLHGRLFTVGVNHMSNGRSDPQSRSWNRMTAGVLFDEGKWALRARGWWRLPESEGDDDNPNISDYYGRAQVWAHLKDGDQTYSVMLRSNLGIGGEPVRGALQLDYTFPFWGGMKGYIQLFHGYGDGLINYDNITTRASAGIMLIDWM